MPKVHRVGIALATALITIGIIPALADDVQVPGQPGRQCCATMPVQPPFQGTDQERFDAERIEAQRRDERIAADRLQAERDWERRRQERIEERRLQERAAERAYYLNRLESK